MGQDGNEIFSQHHVNLDADDERPIRERQFGGSYRVQRDVA
jgi:hypothetical protein